MRPLREKLRDAAHTAILDAAEAAFAEHGVDAPMERIAAKAGVAVGTLYNHFENRAELLEALLDARRAELIAATAAAVKATEGQRFEPRLVATLEQIVAATRQQMRFRQLIFQADLPMKRSGRNEAVKELAQVFSGLLEQGRKEGVLAKDPGELQPVILSSLLAMAFGLSLKAPDRLSLERIPAFVAHQFVHGASAK